MSKESFYFSHDYNARNDPRLVKLAMKESMFGVGLYWCIIEMLYEQNGYIKLDSIESIAYELHTECDRIKIILKEYDLFKFKNESFYSDSVLRRLKIRNEKSGNTRLSALKRWYPEIYKDANAMQPQSDCNARKGKERKGKKKKEKDIFIPPTIENVKQYFVENGYSEQSAIKAFNHYQLADWHDTEGKPVLAWKQKMHTVWFKPENRKQIDMMP